MHGFPSPSSHAALETATLSVLVIARNEEKNLDDCLSSLTFADEIVVVLDNTTDGSEAIIRKYTDKIVIGAWKLWGDRRHAGLDVCTGAWVLEVDADERVPPGLAREVRETIRNSAFDYHPIPVDNYVGKRLVKYGWGAVIGKNAYMGLFRRGCKQWHNQRVHAKVTFIGRCGPALQQRLTHYVDDDLADMLNRLNRYTTNHALDLIDSGKIDPYPRNVLRFFSRFYKCFFRRQGYREGMMGFIIAVCAGLYPILSHAKAQEMLGWPAKPPAK